MIGTTYLFDYCLARGLMDMGTLRVIQKEMESIEVFDTLCGAHVQRVIYETSCIWKS